MELHRKIKYNEKVCCAEGLDSRIQGQGHNGCVGGGGGGGVSLLGFIIYVDKYFVEQVIY